MDTWCQPVREGCWSDLTLAIVRSTSTRRVRSRILVSGPSLMLTWRCKLSVRSFTVQRPVLPNSEALLLQIRLEPHSVPITLQHLVVPRLLLCALITDRTQHLWVRSSLKQYPVNIWPSIHFQCRILCEWGWLQLIFGLFLSYLVLSLTSVYHT